MDKLGSVPPRPIGVFGGTFDPIHFGHLRTAYHIYLRLKLDHIRLMPCHLPAHRDTPLTASQHRLAMLNIAIENIDGLVACDLELQRDTPSYTYDSLVQLQAQFPNHPLVLIIGGDSFSSFKTWHQWDKIIQLVSIVVVQRHAHNSSLPSLDNISFTDINDLFFEGSTLPQIALMKTESLEISASHIRRIFARGEIPYFLLPNKAIDYVRQNHLYDT